MLVYACDDDVARWVEGRLGIKFSPPYAAIGIARGGAPVAGVVYSEFMWPNIHMTIASTSPRWATRQVIGRLFAYPFVELKCRRVTAITGTKNQSARSFLCRLGFILEGYHPGLFADDDGMSFGLQRDGAERWMRGGVSREGQPAAVTA